MDVCAAEDALVTSALDQFVEFAGVTSATVLVDAADADRDFWVETLEAYGNETGVATTFVDYDDSFDATRLMAAASDLLVVLLEAPDDCLAVFEAFDDASSAFRGPNARTLDRARLADRSTLEGSSLTHVRGAGPE